MTKDNREIRVNEDSGGGSGLDDRRSIIKDSEEERRSGKERRCGTDRRSGFDRREGRELPEIAEESGEKGDSPLAVGRNLNGRLAEFIRWIPKVELHVHLEGCIRPTTAKVLITRYNSDDPPLEAKDIRKLYRFDNLTEFVYSMEKVSNNIKTPQDLAKVAEEMMTTLVLQNVRYVEFDCALSKYVRLGHSLESVVKAIKDPVDKFKATHDFDARLVVNLIRHHGPDIAQSLLDQIIELSDDFIVGIGLSGDERAHPAALFKDIFESARGAGLKRTVHAGEDAGPESVWSALKTLRADRIDHGIRATDDESLVRYLHEQQIPVTQCITSNRRLGLINDVMKHPFPDLFRRGLNVTLNTDDPEIFHITLTSEYLLAGEVFGLGADDFQRIVINGIRASFLSEEEKEAKIEDVKDEIHFLRQELGIGMS